MTMRLLRLLVPTLFWIVQGSGYALAADVGAIGEDGKPVDWWFIYKVPHLVGAGGKDDAIGLEYVYFDVKTNKLVESSNKLLDGKGALDLTLNSVLKNAATTTGYILYNDEMPDSVITKENRKDDGSLGHTKGVIAFDTQSKTAFWLLHSWPKFPDLGPHPQQPALNFGQTFLCLSLDIDTARQIAVQMANHQEPQVYEPRIPTTLPASDPLVRLTQKLNPNASGDSDDLPFKTRAGLDFRVIAKNRKWGKDFWNGLVGPELKEDIDVETWIRGKNVIPPIQDTDGVHKTFDIKFVDLTPIAKYQWPENADHAKWAVSTGVPPKGQPDNGKNHKWVCVGDINRMVSQEKRGGGTIAFQNDALWSILHKSETTAIVPPPGHNNQQARTHLKVTHKPAN